MSQLGTQKRMGGASFRFGLRSLFGITTATAVVFAFNRIFGREFALLQVSFLFGVLVSVVMALLANVALCLTGLQGSLNTETHDNPYKPPAARCQPDSDPRDQKR